MIELRQVGWEMNKHTKCLLISTMPSEDGLRDNLSALQFNLNEDYVSDLFKAFDLRVERVWTFVSDLGVQLVGDNVEVSIHNDEAYEAAPEAAQFHDGQFFYVCKISSSDPQKVEDLRAAFLAHFDAAEVEIVPHP